MTTQTNTINQTKGNHVNTTALSTKFPVWITVRLGFGFSGQEWQNAIHASKRVITMYTPDMLESPNFHASEHAVELDLANVSVRELGFTRKTSFTDVCARAKEFELMHCPCEVGPQLRLQWDQPEEGELLVGMEPIIVKNMPRVFQLRGSYNTHDQSLGWCSVEEDRPLSLDTRLLFVIAQRAKGSVRKDRIFVPERIAWVKPKFDFPLDCPVWKTIIIDGKEIDLVKVDGEFFDSNRMKAGEAIKRFMIRTEALNLGFVPWEAIVELAKDTATLHKTYRDGSSSTSCHWYFPQHGKETQFYESIRTIELEVGRASAEVYTGRQTDIGWNVEIETKQMHKFECSSIYWFVFTKPRKQERQ